MSKTSRVTYVVFRGRRIGHLVSNERLALAEPGVTSKDVEAVEA